MKKGVTLVEIIVALGCVTIVMGGLLALMVVSSRSVALADNRIKAIHFARNYMEQKILTNNYVQLAIGAVPNAAVFTNPYATNIRFYIGYSVATNVSPPAKNIFVTNRWIEWSSAWHPHTSAIVLSSTMSSELHK